ncbi:conserved Plasmodium protein, unknown function [Plasmodium ovale wallikeri]|uniref:Uncharacterized protein n=1 Tax=Plasmodium ovale wallikeri TaxID=864142 RepID=A0A1A8YQA5_PLAOA|nr:conserved Plasmodium protein, unknown function [Plasmodium ovale wallikeri]
METFSGSDYSDIAEGIIKNYENKIKTKEKKGNASEKERSFLGYKDDYNFENSLLLSKGHTRSDDSELLRKDQRRDSSYDSLVDDFYEKAVTNFKEKCKHKNTTNVSREEEGEEREGGEEEGEEGEEEEGNSNIFNVNKGETQNILEKDHNKLSIKKKVIQRNNDILKKNYNKPLMPLLKKKKNATKKKGEMRKGEMRKDKMRKDNMRKVSHTNEWNSYQNDLAKYKLSKEELEKKKKNLQSKNLDKVKMEYQQRLKKMREREKKNVLTTPKNKLNLGIWDDNGEENNKQKTKLPRTSKGIITNMKGTNIYTHDKLCEKDLASGNKIHLESKDHDEIKKKKAKQKLLTKVHGVQRGDMRTAVHDKGVVDSYHLGGQHGASENIYQRDDDNYTILNCKTGRNYRNYVKYSFETSDGLSPFTPNDLPHNNHYDSSVTCNSSLYSPSDEKQHSSTYYPVRNNKKYYKYEKGTKIVTKKKKKKYKKESPYSYSAEGSLTISTDISNSTDGDVIANFAKHLRNHNETLSVDLEVANLKLEDTEILQIEKKKFNEKNFYPNVNFTFWMGSSLDGNSPGHSICGSQGEILCDSSHRSPYLSPNLFSPCTSNPSSCSSSFDNLFDSDYSGQIKELDSISPPDDNMLGLKRVKLETLKYMKKIMNNVKRLDYDEGDNCSYGERQLTDIVEGGGSDVEKMNNMENVRDPHEKLMSGSENRSKGYPLMDLLFKENDDEDEQSKQMWHAGSQSRQFSEVTEKDISLDGNHSMCNRLNSVSYSSLMENDPIRCKESTCMLEKGMSSGRNNTSGEAVEWEQTGETKQANGIKGTKDPDMENGDSETGGVIAADSSLKHPELPNHRRNAPAKSKPNDVKKYDPIGKKNVIKTADTDASNMPKKATFSKVEAKRSCNKKSNVYVEINDGGRKGALLTTGKHKKGGNNLQENAKGAVGGAMNSLNAQKKKTPREKKHDVGRNPETQTKAQRGTVRKMREGTNGEEKAQKEGRLISQKIMNTSINFDDTHNLSEEDNFIFDTYLYEGGEPKQENLEDIINDQVKVFARNFL